MSSSPDPLGQPEYDDENISFLSKITSKMDVAIAYTFTLPPPPPNGGG